MRVNTNKKASKIEAFLLRRDEIFNHRQTWRPVYEAG